MVIQNVLQRYKKDLIVRLVRNLIKEFYLNISEQLQAKECGSKEE